MLLLNNFTEKDVIGHYELVTDKNTFILKMGEKYSSVEKIKKFNCGCVTYTFEQFKISESVSDILKFCESERYSIEGMFDNYELTIPFLRIKRSMNHILFVFNEKYDLIIKKKTLMSFSERNGYTKVYKIGNCVIRFYKK